MLDGAFEGSLLGRFDGVTKSMVLWKALSMELYCEHSMGHQMVPSMGHCLDEWMEHRMVFYWSMAC